MRQNLGSVLILEDEELIVLEVEDCLRRSGYAIAAAFPSNAAAIEWLKVYRADVALLDIGLRDGECTEIARLLRARDIPFVIHSANRHDPDFHDECLFRIPLALKAKPP